MRAAYRSTSNMAPALSSLMQAVLVVVASMEQGIPSDSRITRGGGPFTEMGNRRLQGAFTLRQQHHLRVRQSGAVDVEVTVTFGKLAESLTSVDAPIISDTNMHCLQGDVIVSDGDRENVAVSRKVSGRNLIASFSVPDNPAADTYTFTMRYSIGSGICETGDGGPKRFYLPWVQSWGDVAVNSTSYQIEFPDEPLDVGTFVCLGALDMATKCGTRLGKTQNGVLVYQVTRFLDDAYFEWEMPRSPSKGYICPYSWGTGFVDSGRSCAPVEATPSGTNANVAKANSEKDVGNPKQILLFIIIAGSVLGVAIVIGQGYNYRRFTSKGAGNPEQNERPVSPRSSRENLSAVAYLGYGLLLFFAYWFGASRFDYDGDGDFDQYDVQAYLKDKGILRKQFKKSRFKNKPKQGKPAVLKALQKAAGLGAARDRPDTSESPEENPDDGIRLDDVEITEEGAQRPEKRDKAERVLTEQARPWFTIINGVVALLLWMIFASKLAAEGTYNWFDAKAGLEPSETFDLKLTDISNCDDLRPQIWRWISYQYIHVGFIHILTNVALLEILGIPLEGSMGTGRLIIMFNIGVFGGACACLIFTPHTPTVGMSGGIYALFGVQLADLMINWHSKRYRLPTLMFLVFLFVDELLLNAASANSSTSHSAHFGGFFFGMLIGLVLTDHQDAEGVSFERWDQWGRPLLIYGSVVVGTLLAIVTFLWTLGSWPPREPFDPTRWCWARAVSSYRSFGNNEWNCIRCATQDCIQSWSYEPNIRAVTVDWCKETGWFSHDLTL